MNNNLTEIVFVLDRSRSMQHLTDDTIGGFNSFIEHQKTEDGDAQVTTILFDDKYEVLHDGINLSKVPMLTSKEYFARGTTALLDAIGKTINTVGDRLNKTNEQDRPGKVIIVITTDGYENASVEFSAEDIKQMIKHQKGKYNWEFIFLGANIDSENVAGNIGIAKAANYTSNAVGARSVFTTMDSAISQYRDKGCIDDNWSNDIK